MKNDRPFHVSETWEQIVILGSSWNFFLDKEIQIFRCFILIKLKFLFILTTEIDRQTVWIVLQFNKQKINKNKTELKNPP